MSNYRIGCKECGASEYFHYSDCPLLEKKKLFEQFDQAHEEVQRFKAAVPQIFPEWQSLKAAEEEFERAKERLEQAQQRWEKL